MLSRCSGSARAEAIQPRALYAGMVSIVRLQQLSDAMGCWLQSNVKDMVRLIARLLWGTKVEFGSRRNSLVAHSVRYRRPTQRGRRPSSRQHSISVERIVMMRVSSADEGNSSANEDGSK